MRVLLDSNQWIESLLLRSPTGASLTHYLLRSSGALVLPEVVRLEVEAGLLARGEAAAKRIEGGLADLQRILGSAPSLIRPSRENLAAAIASRFEELDDLIQEVPLRHEHTVEALRRVVAHEPPSSGKREEFRDHLIWQSVLEVGSDGSPVVFVSADSDFFADGKASETLATTLLKDLDGTQVIATRSLASCLQLVEADSPPHDEDGIADALESALYERLVERADARGLRLGARDNTALAAFATEDPRIVSVDFQQRSSVHGASGEISSWIEAEGEAAANLHSGTLEDVRLRRVELHSFTEDGTPISHRTAYVSGAAFVGAAAREVPWTIRQEL